MSVRKPQSGANQGRRQQRLDWNRGAQLRALNEFPLPSRLVGQGVPVSRATAVSVLRVIDDHQREQETAWPSLKTMAECARRSTRTVQRAMAALEQLGLITVWNETNAQGHPLLVARINWEVVFGGRLAPQELPSPRRPGGRKSTTPEAAPHAEPDDSLTSPDDSLTSPDDSLTSPDDSLTPTLYRKRTRKRPTEPSSPSPPNFGSGCPGASAASWGEVEEELFARGVSAFADAVRIAARSVSPEHVLQLIAEFDRLQQPQWTAGVLYVRVCKAREWLAIDEGWPAVQAPRPTVPATRQRLEQQQLAEQVDRLSDEELRQLVRGHATLRAMAATYGSVQRLRGDPTAQRLLARELASLEEAT